MDGDVTKEPTVTATARAECELPTIWSIIIHSEASTAGRAAGHVLHQRSRDGGMEGGRETVRERDGGAAAAC